MKKRTVKNNIKKTLFFSYSIIFSTLFFILILITQNECSRITNNLKLLNQSKYTFENRVKSLSRKKSLIIHSIENLANERFDFITPEPQPTTITMDIVK